MQHTRHKKGFTLYQILIVVVVFALISGAVYRLYSSGVRVFTEGQRKVDIQKELRLAMEFMKDDLRQARGSKIIIENYGAKIRFVMATGVTNGIATWGPEVSYNIEAGKLKRRQSPSIMVFAENIKTIYFTKNQQTVSVFLQGQKYSESLNFQVKVRN